MSAATNYRRASPKGAATEDDGSVLVTKEQLARFGGGEGRDGGAWQGRRDLRHLLAADRNDPTYVGPTAIPKTVRLAGPSDELDVFNLLKMDLEENATQVAPIDPEKVMLTIQSGTRTRGGFVGVIGKPAIAVVVLIPCQWWWSNGWYFEELVNYVHPDHRKSNHASDLLDFCKWASDEQTRGFGYRVYLVAGVFGARRIYAKISMYRRKLWQVGGCFLYPAPPNLGN